MRQAILTSGSSLLLLAGLASATPVELAGRKNGGGGGDYKAKCEGFRIAGVENVVQVEDSYYYPRGTSLNFTSLQSALVSNDIPSFCRKIFPSQWHMRDWNLIFVLSCNRCSAPSLYGSSGWTIR